MKRSPEFFACFIESLHYQKSKCQVLSLLSNFILYFAIFPIFFTSVYNENSQCVGARLNFKDPVKYHAKTQKVNIFIGQRYDLDFNLEEKKSHYIATW